MTDNSRNTVSETGTVSLNNQQIPEEWYYPATASVNHHENLKLHVGRFRDENKGLIEKITVDSNGTIAERKRRHFQELYASTDWTTKHIHLLNDMDVIKFTMDPAAQRMIHNIQECLVDRQYEAVGKTEESWGGYTLMFRNGFSGDERKPVTETFQQYCEEFYCPILWTLLFGEAGWEDVRNHWAQFKSCTIKVSESAPSFYGHNIFHMHIDGKIGMLEPKNYSQRRMSRLLFSIVKPVVRGEVPPGEAADCSNAKLYGTTVYPVWQPCVGFRNNHEFHNYMQTWYNECGLENDGLPRPHYEIPEELLYRARTGEVLVHKSHASKEYGPQPIHSEPNPCPDRHLYVFDWNNVPGKPTANGKLSPSIEVPEDRIIEYMSVLGDVSTHSFKKRLQEVRETACQLLPKAEKHPGARAAIEEVLNTILCV